MVPGKFLLQVFKLSTLPGLILLPDAPEFTIVEFNDLYLENFQKKKKISVGKAFLSYWRRVARNGIRMIALSFQNRYPQSLTTKSPQKIFKWKHDIVDPETGKFEEKYWDLENIPLLNDKSEVEYIVQTLKEVTPNTLLETAPRQSSAKEKNKLSDLGFKSLIQHGINLIGVLDKEGIYKYASPTYKTILGIEPSALIGKSSGIFCSSGRPGKSDRKLPGT